jgi:hypothetical protein
MIYTGILYKISELEGKSWILKNLCRESLVVPIFNVSHQNCFYIYKYIYIPPAGASACIVMLCSSRSCWQAGRSARPCTRTQICITPHMCANKLWYIENTLKRRSSARAHAHTRARILIAAFPPKPVVWIQTCTVS